MLDREPQGGGPRTLQRVWPQFVRLADGDGGPGPEPLDGSPTVFPLTGAALPPTLVLPPAVVPLLFVGHASPHERMFPARLPVTPRQPVGGAHSSVTIANDVATIGTAMAGGITACAFWP
ncbi:hypothetical protein ACE1SV_68370 [Streptomyces sp. E-15]